MCGIQAFLEVIQMQSSPFGNGTKTILISCKRTSKVPPGLHVTVDTKPQYIHSQAIELMGSNYCTWRKSKLSRREVSKKWQYK